MSTDRIPLTGEYFFEARSFVYLAHMDAVEKFPWWPANPFEAECVIAEECGEAHKALLDMKHKGGSVKDLIKEHAQAAAMHIRQIQALLKAQSDTNTPPGS